MGPTDQTSGPPRQRHAVRHLHVLDYARGDAPELRLERGVERHSLGAGVLIVQYTPFNSFRFTLVRSCSSVCVRLCPFMFAVRGAESGDV